VVEVGAGVQRAHVEVLEHRSAGTGATGARARRCSAAGSGGGCTCRPLVAVRRLRVGGMAAVAEVDGGTTCSPPPSSRQATRLASMDPVQP
jgi:hypothetical protein